MSANPSLISAPRPLAPPGPLDPSHWIAATEAAVVLGISRGNLRRKCFAELETKGMAQKVAPPGGGNPRWFLHRSFNLKLQPGQGRPIAAAPDRADYTARQNTLADHRAACVYKFREANSTWPGLQKDWLPKLISQLRGEHPKLTISRTSLLRWHLALRNPADLVKLIDDRGGNQYAGADPTCWTAFKQLYLNDKQHSLKWCWKQTKAHARSADLQWCSLTACRRQLRKHISAEEDVFHRDKKKWRAQMEPTIEQDPDAWHAGQLWESDHAQLDFLCRFGSSLLRPWLTVWKDWRSRKVVGWVLSTSPNSSTILAALKMGIVDDSNFGGPDATRIDNGRDYDAYIFHGKTKQQRKQRFLDRGYIDEAVFMGIYTLLDINVHFSLPFNPNGKSRTECWFRTVHDHFDKSMATYVGNKPENKPESLKKILNDPAKIPTFEFVREQIGLYIDAFNQSNDHTIADLVDEATGIKLSPNQAMSLCPRRRVMADPDALKLLDQHYTKPVTMQQHGIRISPFGIAAYYGNTESALSPFKALKKKDRPLLNVSFDPADTSVITVYDSCMRFICIARENERGGGLATDRAKVQRLMKRKAQYKKALKFVDSNRDLSILHAGELLLLDSTADEHPPPQSTEPASIQIVQTPLDGQLNKIESARFQQAAGGEVSGGGGGGGGLPDPTQLLDRLQLSERTSTVDDVDQSSLLESFGQPVEPQDSPDSIYDLTHLLNDKEP